MALVKYGGGIVQMSGSIAGNTFARNRYGNYSRSRTKPTNPNTVLQQKIRAAIAELTELWFGTVTSTQRSAWNQYASNVVMKNRLGENTLLSGFNHYIRSNAPLLNQGLAPINDAPTDFTLPDQDSEFAIAAEEATPKIDVTFDTDLAWVGEDDAYMLVYQGSPQNPTRNFFGGPWQYLDKIAGDSVTPPTSPATMTPSIAITAGQKVWCRARIIRADGRLSEFFRSTATVA